MDSTNYKPDIFLTGEGKDLDAFNRLKNSKSSPLIADLFLDQQRELIKINHPQKRLSQIEITAIQQEINGEKDTFLSGCWVYYSWKNTLVHLLDPQDFIRIRTSRNQYKITPEEQEILQACKVGIIGLSVGHSVALNLAIERSAGELRLADFDNLELSNLNRIKTSLLNLGLPKAVIAAREIAEIDPFISVKCFIEGVDEENLNHFLTDGGKLSALVEECDSLNIKILARKEAKNLGIPVLMETSDRGMLDVERFDLEPDRQILHGFIEHLDLDMVKNLKSSEEKIPYLMPMVGIDTMSARLKASALEVGQSIGTWPQIASSVMLGGAILSDTYRRMMLGEKIESGRYIIDPAETIKASPTKTELTSTNKSFRESLSIEAMKGIIDTIELAPQKEIPLTTLESIIESAGKAPSGGNSQPWKWFSIKGYVHMFFDASCSESYMDYNHSASYIALGASLENLKIKANSIGYKANVNFFPLDEESPLVASIHFTKTEIQNEHLANQIPLRYTDRSKGIKESLSEKEIKIIKELCLNSEGIQTEFISDKENISDIAQIVSIGDWLRIMNYDSHNDFIDEEMRWTKEELVERRDGIFVEELNLSSSDLAGLQLLRDKKVIQFMNERNAGQGLKNISSKLVNSAQALIYGFSNSNKKKDFLQAGSFLEHLWLTCTAMNIGFQILNVPIAFLLREKNNDLGDLSPIFKAEIEGMKGKLESIFDNYDEKVDLFIVRLFKSNKPIPTSFRRNLNEILFHE